MSTPSATLPRSLIWLFSLCMLALNVTVLAQVSGEAAPSIGIQHTEGPAVDHIAFWAAGRLANEGAAATAYDRSALAAVQSAGMGFDYRGEMPWFYPPLTQIMTQPFALLDLGWSLILWGAVGLSLFLIAAWRICPDPLALATAGAAGPVFAALFTGQLGLFVAAIAGISLLALMRDLEGRSTGGRMGAWMALLLLKPQTVFVLPAAMAMTGRWRAVMVAVAVGLALIAISVALQGTGGWIAFAETLTGVSDYFMTGDTAQFFWARYANIYGVARFNGLPFWPAVLAQGAMVAAALICAVKAMRSLIAPPAAIAAILAYACVVAAPRIYGYDLPLLVIGALFQTRAAMQVGWGRGEAAVFILAFAVAEFGFLGRPHALALLGPLLIGYAYWRYVHSFAPRAPGDKRAAAEAHCN